MRHILLMVFGFAVLILAIPTVTPLYEEQVESREVATLNIESHTTSNALALRHEDLDKRLGPFLALIWSAVGAAWTLKNLVTVGKLFIGAWRLGANVYDLKKDCTGDGAKVYDCLITASNSLWDIFATIFIISKIPVKERSLEIGSNQWHHQHRSHPELYTVSHIPLINGSMRRTSAASSNNGTWEHHATTYHKNGEEVYHLMYRLAHPDDLGKENDGSIHHYRLQRPAKTYGHTKRQDVVNDEGLVLDYIWQNEDYNVWDELHEDLPSGVDPGAVMGQWMEDNDAEASCAVPIMQYTPQGSTPRTQTVFANQAVSAYGWNDAEYNYQGNLGGWLNECGGTNYWTIG